MCKKYISPLLRLLICFHLLQVIYVILSNKWTTLMLSKSIPYFVSSYPFLTTHSVPLFLLPGNWNSVLRLLEKRFGGMLRYKI